MKALIAIALVLDLLAIGSTTWLNSARKCSSTNPFFSKGLTIYLDSKSYELGFRDDGVMVWRHPK